MNKIHSEVKFFDYLVNYYQKVNTITKTKQKTSSNTIVSSSHPPLESNLIKHKGSTINASSFKIPGDESEIKKVIEQNNYTNQCLKTIGKQLDKIETTFDDYSNSHTSTSKTLEKPLFNLPSDRNKLSLVTQDTHAVDAIEQIFNKLITKPSKEKGIAVITQQPPIITNHELDTSTDNENVTKNNNSNQIILIEQYIQKLILLL